MGVVVAIIVAGGTGERMGGAKPKQFREVAGKPLIIHTLTRFDKSPAVDCLVISCHPDHMEEMADVVESGDISKTCEIVPGGSTRQGSSFNGLKACPDHTDIVIIHDAVRPFIDERMIAETIRAAENTGAATTVSEMIDTVVEEMDGMIASVPDRGRYRRVQTPQGFRYKAIMDAHERAMKDGVTDFTDDCGIIAAAGGKVELVNGSSGNIKITRENDLMLADKLLRSCA